MRAFAPLLAVLVLGLAACGGGSASPGSTNASLSVSTSVQTTPSAAPKPADSAGASAAANPSGATSTTGGDPTGYPIKISFASPAVASWPFYAALSAGFFEQQHLKITMLQMPANVALTALSKGEIDFANSPSLVLEGGIRGLPMKMVLSSWDRTPWTVVGKKELSSLKDLKGRVVGTNQVGTSPYLYLQAALKRDGLTVKDLQLVSSPGTQDAYALLLAGKADAAEVSPPFDASAILSGYHEVQFIGDALEQPYIGLGTTTSFIGEHRPQVVATIKALMDGNAWLKSHPDGAADLIVKNLGISGDTAKLSTEKMLPLLSTMGELPMSGVQQAIDIQAELTQTKSNIKPEDLVDWGPLHAAAGKA